MVHIESLRPGDYIMAHDGQPHRVLRTIMRPYSGPVVGIGHTLGPATLWLTADHFVLVNERPRTLGGHADWSATPASHYQRIRDLRREMTPPERKLWQALRGKQLGVKFRRQHPIGPYIADFYSREARMVIEVDGQAAHGSNEAQEYDQKRDRFMANLGLCVLRFAASDVERNLAGVFDAIQAACQQIDSPDHAEWVMAGDLHTGDTIFCGRELTGVHVKHVQHVMATEAEGFEIEAEGAQSFLTEVCAVQNGRGRVLAPEHASSTPLARPGRGRAHERAR